MIQVCLKELGLDILGHLQCAYGFAILCLSVAVYYVLQMQYIMDLTFPLSVNPCALKLKHIC